MRRAALVIVSGAPAAGKSTLAAALAARFGLTLLAKDDFKERLFAAHGAGDAAASRKLSDRAFAALFEEARARAAAGEALLLEGNFRAGEHEPRVREALGACAAGPGRLLQILCAADRATRRARLEARTRDPSRHPGHRDGEQARALDSQDGASEPAFLELPGERLVHRTDGAAAQLDELFAKVERWISARGRDIPR